MAHFCSLESSICIETVQLKPTGLSKTSLNRIGIIRIKSDSHTVYIGQPYLSNVQCLLLSTQLIMTKKFLIVT